jgi:hypothetical protein
MKKFIALALFCAFALTVHAEPAHADDTASGVASDVNAVQKDNAAIGRTNSGLAKDRAAKANDKATGNMGGQAVDSVKVGVDKATRSEKNTEKSVDTKTLNSDVNNATTKQQQ